MGSGNKLQKQKKGPGSSGESKAERRHLGKERGAPERLGAEGGCREIECWNTVLELVWGFIFVYIL